MSEQLTPRGARRGIAAEQLRRHNLSAVLDRVHLAGRVSRAQLSTETGLNRSTIRHLLAELSDLGLVVEDGDTTRGNPGRPSTVARPRPAGAVVLAIEMEVDFTAVATVGLGGRIFDKVRVANPSTDAAPQQIIDLVTELAAPLVASLPSGSNIVGAGAAAAGLVRRADSFLSVSPNRGWHDTPLGDMLSSSLGIDRVRVENEANVSALAEARRGAARDARHLIFVTGEVGLGVGVINNGVPLNGTSGFAGEAGHTIINPNGRPCRCGSIGCWETEVGEEAFARLTGIEWGGGRQSLVDELLHRAHIGDPAVFEVFRQTGRWLGLGVGNLVNMFNPDLIVFGGFYHPLFPFLAESITAAANVAALSAAWESCRICRSDLGLDARLIGASELIFTEVFTDPTLISAG